MCVGFCCCLFGWVGFWFLSLGKFVFNHKLTPVVDRPSLALVRHQAGRHVLCHSASDICSNNGLLVTTHDRLYKLLTHPYKTNRKSTKNSTIPSFFFAGKLLDLSGRLGDG